MDVNAEDVIADLLQELTAAKRDKAYQVAAVAQVQRELNKVTEERSILAQRIESLMSDGPSVDGSITRLEKERDDALRHTRRLERLLLDNGVIWRDAGE